MLNSDLEAIFREMSGLSNVAAFRYIYDLGFYDGAGVTPTPLATSPSVTQPVPTVAKKTATKAKIVTP